MEYDWLKDKVCIVTGGASGIGAAIATKVVERGGIVLIADLNSAAAKAMIESREEKTHRLHFLRTDVTKATEIAALVERAATLGPLQFLVNSAGLQTYGTAETTSEADWDRTLDVNLKSMFLTARAVIPEMRSNGGGGIVNISSVQAFQSQRNVLAYATAKTAVVGLTRCLGLDHTREGIRVNCICPGSIDTPMLRYGASQHGPVEEVLQDWSDHHPIGRIGTAAEIAQTALFLLSPAAGFLVGQPIVADGGLGSVIF